MQATYISLSESQVGLAALLIVINAAISLGLRLGLERALVWASVRTVGQLLLLGLILKWIFELSHWYAVGGIMVVMTVIYVGQHKAPKHYKNKFINNYISKHIII